MIDEEAIVHNHMYDDYVRETITFNDLEKFLTACHDSVSNPTCDRCFELDKYTKVEILYGGRSFRFVQNRSSGDTVVTTFIHYGPKITVFTVKGHSDTAEVFSFSAYNVSFGDNKYSLRECGVPDVFMYDLCTLIIKWHFQRKLPPVQLLDIF